MPELTIIKPGYKKTAVGVIPEDWEVTKFGEFLEFKNGVNASKDDYGKGVKFINVLEVINNSSLIRENIPGEVQITQKQFKNYEVKKGDILFNRTSETQQEIALASVYLDNYPTVFGGFIIRGRFVNDVYLNEFKKYIFRETNVRKQIISKGQGAVRVNIGQTDLEKIPIPIPPLPEQKAIADCLGAWDKAIEIQTQLIEAKKQFKKGLMQGFFNGSLTVSFGALREPQGTKGSSKGTESSHPKSDFGNNRKLRTLRLLEEPKPTIIKAKEGEDFTEDWEEVKLGTHFNERKETGYSDKELLSIGEEGVYPQSESNKRDISNADKSKYKLIKPGDIGYNTMRLWQGRSALSNLEGIVSPAYTILKPILSRTVPEFFAYYFKTDSVIHKFYRNSQGMVSDTLQCRYKDFKNIKLKIPPFDLQNSISQVLQTVEREIELEEKKLEQLQIQKKGLMQVLLTGEKRLKKGA